MKKFVYLFICLFVGSANGGVIQDFTGGYDVGNWTQTLDGGTIDLSGAPLTIVQISSNGGGGSSSTEFTIAALADGLVSFDWGYTTADVDGSFFDPFGFLLNGIFSQLTVNGLFGPQAGTESFAVVTGDIFGFGAQSFDSVFGSATTTVSNFSAPVPEPASLTLLGLGLAAIGFSRKKKSA